MLFHIPIFWAVLITAFDVLALLALQGLGMRLIEAVILVLVATIGGCYFVELFVLPKTKPDLLEMGQALLKPSLSGEGMLGLAIGIIGATVMPHNLYLHSALVQSRKIKSDDRSVAQAIRYNTFDTVFALSLAFFVNAAILVLAAIVFHGKQTVGLPEGKVATLNEETDWIRVAYLTLAPLVGTVTASLLFAVALLASGQSSTISGTMAGQVVMEGFFHWRIRPWVRRLITRLIAIIPAILFIGFRGDNNLTDLLNLTQVVLALQLPFAMFPLLHFTSSRAKMGRFANGWWLKIASWTSAITITFLAIYALPDLFKKAMETLRGE
jgi:manganese transport protein